MENKGLLKKITINLFLIIINVVVFSRAFLGVEISANNLPQAIFGVAVIVFSILLFLFVNTNLANRKKTHETESRHFRTSDTESTLDLFYNEFKKQIKNTSSVFEENLSDITSQIESFNKKKQAIDKILAEKFDTGEMTYHKFSGTVKSVETLFRSNIESVISKIKSFDEADITMTQTDISREYQSFIRKAKDFNEEIILKLDKLIIETLKLEDNIKEDIESMSAVKELNQLIENVKLYKRKDETL